LGSLVVEVDVVAALESLNFKYLLSIRARSCGGASPAVATQYCSHDCERESQTLYFSHAFSGAKLTTKTKRRLKRNRILMAKSSRDRTMAD
jgi:hypothetical protein